MNIPHLAFSVYSLMLFLGGIAAAVILWSFYLRVRIRERKGKWLLISLWLIILPSLVLFLMGAALGDNLFHYLNGEPFGSAGISFLGGAVPLLLAFLPVLWRGPDNLYVNTVMLAIPLMHAFGRIGCLFGGCCYGIPCSFGVIYWEGSRAAEMYGYGTTLFPTQILESLVCFAIFFLFLFRFREHRYLYYTFGYGVYRFLAEFLRGDNRGATGTFLSPSQLMSLFLILFGILYAVILRRKKRPTEVCHEAENE